MRDKQCLASFKRDVAFTLVDCNSAFRVVGGAHSHLEATSRALGDAKYADSVRESIHAVESVARLMAGTTELAAALSSLEKQAGLHGAMKKGVSALYGYASDEEGIRHPLLEAGDAKVDEVDAIFMLGAIPLFDSSGPPPRGPNQRAGLPVRGGHRPPPGP